MAVKSYPRGHEIVSFDGINYEYSDNGYPFDDSRPCIRCGEMPTIEGHDACLGSIPNVMHACCGHGVSTPYYIDNQGNHVKGLTREND